MRVPIKITVEVSNGLYAWAVYARFSTNQFDSPLLPMLDLLGCSLQGVASQADIWEAAGVLHQG